MKTKKYGMTSYLFLFWYTSLTQWSICKHWNGKSLQTFLIGYYILQFDFW